MQLSTIKRRVVRLSLAAALAVGVAACGSDDDATNASSEERPSFTIGAGADNPNEAAVLEFVRDDLAEKHGIEIELKELADSVALNEAVNREELDGHVAQHWPYLSAIKDERGWKVEPVAPLWVSRFSIYSDEYDSLDALPDGATVSLPDDPSSQALALRVLRDQGLLTLKPDANPIKATLQDVATNPRNLKLKPLVINQIARALQDVDAAVAPAGQFANAGIDGSKRITSVPADPSYAIQLVVREGAGQDERFAKLVETFNDPEIAAFVDRTFGEVAKGVAGESEAATDTTPASR